MIALHFDGCDDGSEPLARALCASLGLPLGTSRAIDTGTPNAGRARRMAMAVGQDHLADRADAVLLTTDADSVPADDWIAASCAALDRADVVSGRVVREQDLPNPLQDRVERYLDRLYDFRRSIDPLPWEPRPAHHYTAGASLGFRAAAYRALGGFEARASAEDAGIVDAAYRLGLRVRRDRAVWVTTSARRIGRVSGGLADHLRSLDTSVGADATRVGHPADAAWQYRRHALARAAFVDLSDAAAKRLADAIGRTIDDVLQEAGDAPNAEAFAMRIVPAAAGAERLVSLAEAERILAGLDEHRHERQP